MNLYWTTGLSSGTRALFFLGLWYCRYVLTEEASPLKKLTVNKILGLCLGCYAVAAVVYPFSRILYGLVGIHFALLGAILAIEFSRRFFGNERGLNTLTSLKPLYFLGLISYGYYVYHGFCLMLTDRNLVKSFMAQIFNMELTRGSVPFIFMVVIVPFFMAWASYHFVEKRGGTA